MSEIQPLEIGLLQEKFDLHNSAEVNLLVETARSQGESIPNTPDATVGYYLGHLANRHSLFQDFVRNDAASNRDLSARQDRQVDSHLVKAENVPEGFFELQKRLALERGAGELEVTDDVRAELTRVARSDQHDSLTRWTKYLSSDDAPYPTWFRYYTVRSLLKLSTLDKEKGVFRSRSNGTTSPYPDLNREALSQVFDLVVTSRAGGDIKLEEARQLAAGGNFGKLYAHTLMNIKPASPELRNVTEGSWRRFDIDEDEAAAEKLADSLQGFATGWCTAGKSTAEFQLQEGPFYVYYTKDHEGNNAVPRIAIRTEDDYVVEVRGIEGTEFGMEAGDNSDQGLEPNMYDIAEAKLGTLYDGDKYGQRVRDMRMLTTLHDRYKTDPECEISDAEWSFLVGLDHPIEGFSYNFDPRASQILNARLTAETLATGLQVDSLSGDIAKDLIKRGVVEPVLNNLRFFEATNETVLWAALKTYREDGVMFWDYLRDNSIATDAHNSPTKDAQRKWFTMIVEKYEGPMTLKAVREALDVADTIVFAKNIPEMSENDLDATITYIFQRNPSIVEDLLNESKVIGVSVLDLLIKLNSNEELIDDDIIERLSPASKVVHEQWLDEQDANEDRKADEYHESELMNMSDAAFDAYLAKKSKQNRIQ